MNNEYQSLSDRLRAVECDVPETLVPHVLAAARAQTHKSRAPRRFALGGASLLGAVVLNSALVVALPAYGRAMANIPVMRQISMPALALAGIDTSGTGVAPEDVAPMHDVADNAGYRVELVGGYADNLRTILFVTAAADGKTTPAKTWGAATATLTDQYGHTYKQINNSGLPSLEFEPLTGAATTGTAQLTLHITTIALFPDGSDHPDATSPASIADLKEALPEEVGNEAAGGVWIPDINGNWTLRGDITAHAGQQVSLPQPAHNGDTTYTTDSITATPTVINITWTEVGGDVTRARAEGNLELPVLYDPSGKEVHLLGLNMGEDISQPIPSDVATRATQTVLFPSAGPGTYHLDIGNNVSVEFTVS